MSEQIYQAIILDSNESLASVVSDNSSYRMGEKPFKCYICNKLSHLKYHISEHTEERSHQCKI